jgi:hypothetical protein
MTLLVEDIPNHKKWFGYQTSIQCQIIILDLRIYCVVTMKKMISRTTIVA